MSNCVHVIKRHEEYGDSEHFNYKTGEFRDLLDSLGCEICGDEDSGRFECPIEQYKKALTLMRAYAKYGITNRTQEMFNDAEVDLCDVEEQLSSLGGDADYVTKSMENFYNERDKKSDWISFVSW